MDKDPNTLPPNDQPEANAHRVPIGSTSFHVSPPELSEPSEPIQETEDPAQTDVRPLSVPRVKAKTDKKTPATEKKKREGGVLSLLLTIIVAIVFVQVVNAFFFQSYRVVGSSMHPTLEEGDFLIISKIGKTFSKLKSGDYEPKRNDIIVFKSPRDDLQLVKRVIGLPGERVVVSEGKITVYNDEFPKGFDPDKDTDHADTLPVTSGRADITVPKGHLFVSGDNREGGNSLDSRNELGTIPESLVVGTLSLRIFPLGGARFF